VTIACNRRDIVAGLAAAAITGATGPARTEATVPPRARKISFGAAANHYVLPTDAAYRAALARHCDVLVAEGAMKWAEIRAKREAFDFKAGDELMSFANNHGMEVRGHTLLWNEANPDWLKSMSSAGEAERELRRHIERVVQHYATSIKSWDVVNEPIAEKPRNSMDLRGGVWTSLLGERHIDLAFKVAHDVAPTQQRVLNEYGIEHATAQDRLKRAAFKRLIFDLKSRGVPITAVGLQGHLDGSKEIDTDGISAFCNDMARAGLDVLVTELDVNDIALPADPAKRDAIAAEKARTFLTAVFAGCRPTLVCTWGLTDRYTWMPTWFKRPDGSPNRPLPLDKDLNPKPMMAVLSSFVAR
jgi:endo-1,4-beta-xylanase